MALFNYATKEITLKIVYYGPGLSGKTTNLQHLHSILNPETKGKLLSLSTEADRTLFFDFLPVELGKIRDFSIRFQLYTVPGQVRYNATRKIVLKGADAVVFVADSQREMKEQNIDSFANMRDNLFSNNINPDEIPIVLQYNKRDLKNICSVDDLNSDLNRYNYSFTEAAAINGIGVEDSFKLITKLLLQHISRKHEIEIQPLQGKERTLASEGAFQPEVPPAAHYSSRPMENQFEVIAGQEPKEGTRKVKISDKEKHEIEIQPLQGKERTLASEGASRTPVPATAHSFPHTAMESQFETVAARELQEEKTGAFGTSDRDSGQTAVSPEDKGEPATFEGMTQALPVLPDTLAIVVEEMTKLNGILADVRDSLFSIRKEIGMLKDIKNRQEQTHSLLRDVLQALEDKKERKSWFRF